MKRMNQAKLPKLQIKREQLMILAQPQLQFVAGGDPSGGMFSIKDQVACK